MTSWGSHTGVVLAVTDRLSLAAGCWGCPSAWSRHHGALGPQLVIDAPHTGRLSIRSSLFEKWGVGKREDRRQQVICAIQIDCSREQTERRHPGGEKTQILSPYLWPKVRNQSMRSESSPSPSLPFICCLLSKIFLGRAGGE